MQQNIEHILAELENLKQENIELKEQLLCGSEQLTQVLILWLLQIKYLNNTRLMKKSWRGKQIGSYKSQRKIK